MIQKIITILIFIVCSSNQSYSQWNIDSIIGSLWKNKFICTQIPGQFLKYFPEQESTRISKYYSSNDTIGGNFPFPDTLHLY